MEVPLAINGTTACLLKGSMFQYMLGKHTILRMFLSVTVVNMNEYTNKSEDLPLSSFFPFEKGKKG